jgi:hypothetical protein
MGYGHSGSTLLDIILGCLRYQSYLEATYQAVFRASGSHNIVNSSKNPCRAATIAKMDAEIDFCFIHLVRDGRAVGWSMLKKKARQSKTPLSKKQQSMVFFKAMIGWIIVNIQAEFVGRKVNNN